MTTETAASGEVGLGRGGRMSRKRKRDAVLRLLRGEDLEALSRALGATAATLTGWQDTFVAAKLGEMLLERELLEAKIAALEAKRPLARRRSRR
jgi:transposase